VKSRKTTIAGLVALGCGLLLVWGPRDLGPVTREVLATGLLGALAALGITARDDGVTSEGTDARYRRREPPPQIDP